MVSGKRKIAVIGGGPAGLWAAEAAVRSGFEVTVFEAKPSVGRKFLVAGKSGLNLTNAAGFEDFSIQYSGSHFPRELWRNHLSRYDSEALRQWALGLGVDTFTASGGKVFPETKKAAPLLRAWVLRLRKAGVVFKAKHEWTGIDSRGAGTDLCFSTDTGVEDVRVDAVVLAMGGASWPQTGSTGKWMSVIEALGVQVVPLQSANCGWEVAWTDSTRSLIEGRPLQNLHVHASDCRYTGELMVTRYGFEGTPLYALGPSLRAMEAPAITIDFKPTFTQERLVAKMESARRNFFKEASLRWKLSPVAAAIIRQFYGDFDNAEALAAVVKACRIPLERARPVVEAISTAGGVAWSELNAQLMLEKQPGIFCAGEMIDWEAPTGGFLMQGCYVTGCVAGEAAAAYCAAL